MNLGDKIKDIREFNGLTQKQLAETLGVSAVTVTRYENGDREPNIDMLEKIAHKLNVSVGIFFNNNHLKTNNSKSGFSFTFFFPDDKYIEEAKDYLKELINLLEESQESISILSNLSQKLNISKSQLITYLSSLTNYSIGDITSEKNILNSLKIEENSLQNLDQSEIEELINFLKISAKVKLEELFAKHNKNE